MQRPLQAPSEALSYRKWVGVVPNQPFPTPTYAATTFAVTFRGDFLGVFAVAVLSSRFAT